MNPLWKLSELLSQSSASPPAVDAILRQFNGLARDEQEELSREHLLGVMRYACHHLSHYRERIPKAWLKPGSPMNRAQLAELPILSRSDLRRLGQELEVKAPPPGFVARGKVSTSGSSGTPISTPRGSGSSLLFQRLRQRWHRAEGRDFEAKCAFINAPGVARLLDGPSWALDYGKGPSAHFDLRATGSEQLSFLIEARPRYLVTYPSVLRELLRVSRKQRSYPEELSEVLLSSEPCPPDLDQETMSTWGARALSTYSASEAGPISFQRKVDGSEWLQAENVLVEVVDEKGQPVGPGEVGRILISTLQDFTRPLIRYEMGDYAELGPGGQGDLKTILGRSRTMIRHPDGRRRWPYFELDSLSAAARIERWQIRQRLDHSLEVRVVGQGLAPLHASIIDTVRKASFDLPIRVTEVSEIPREPSGKYFEVWSEFDDREAPRD